MENLLTLSPITWLAIGLIIMALEVFAPGFIIFWFGIGGVFTALCTWIGIAPTAIWQWFIFFTSSFLCLIFWHTFFKKYYNRKHGIEEVRDPTLKDLKGKVTKQIRPDRSGEVELFDFFHGVKKWKAESDEIINEEEEIVVLESTGIKLRVKKFS